MILSFEQEENIGDSSKNVDVELRDLPTDPDNNVVAFKNAPDNLKLTSPEIQKDIVSAVSNETVSVIIRDLGDSLFAIMIDESRDISRKEKMAIVLRYVNKNGLVVECFLGVEHVTSTTTLSLKATLDNFFSRHGLSFSRLRGQGYDGASNMQGEFNGLKTLVLKENRCAYYIHCFAHQLQLALVALAKNHDDVNDLFNIVAIVVNIVGASSKRCDLLRDKQACKVIEALSNGELSSGKVLNQETNLQRASDMRWGSHYGTLMSIILMFSSIIDVLEIVAKDGSNSEQRFHAKNIFKLMQSFDFVFSLFLMKDILGFTNELSQALQRKDQDIVNAMNLVEACKQALQLMRDNGWETLLSKVYSFCANHDIDVPNMDDKFFIQGRSQRKAQGITNNLIRLAELYPDDFSNLELMALDSQLDVYILDMHSNVKIYGIETDWRSGKNDG
ncbi:zinc finger MYM-type protein 1-like [Pistacia vera]|uniref:zinc finger MYM-type protein 1-like n=1 Tax=Pistacia vera TaxID=55513 RepID=UPI001263B1F2|nr:zinc finger MYM-type protein 1-like [Pistacia vera]